jgi:hypothetical protein
VHDPGRHDPVGVRRLRCRRGVPVQHDRPPARASRARRPSTRRDRGPVRDRVPAPTGEHVLRPGVAGRQPSDKVRAPAVEVEAVRSVPARYGAGRSLRCRS